MNGYFFLDDGYNYHDILYTLDENTISVNTYYNISYSWCYVLRNFTAYISIYNVYQYNTENTINSYNNVQYSHQYYFPVDKNIHVDHCVDEYDETTPARVLIKCK